MKPSVKPAARLRVECLPAMPWNPCPSSVEYADRRAGGKEDSTPVICWPPILEIIEDRLPNFLR